MEFGPERRAALQTANLVQGRYDRRLIMESEAILASLDGPDVDSGTAVEIGYGFAQGLLIVGLRTDSRRSADNELRQADRVTRCYTNGPDRSRDRAEDAVEDQRGGSAA